MKLEIYIEPQRLGGFAREIVGITGTATLTRESPLRESLPVVVAAISVSLTPDERRDANGASVASVGIDHLPRTRTMLVQLLDEARRYLEGS